MLNSSIWQFLIDALGRNERAALLLVVASKGSSPGTAGAKMAVTVDGKTLGTIGGGQVEFELAGLAQKSLLASDHPALRLFRRYHDDHHAESSGHICGGSQQVLLWLCRAADLHILQTLQAQQAARQPVVLSLTEQGVQTSPWTKQVAQPCFDYRDHSHWCYRETIGLRKQAYIIGGGHVGLALSQLLSRLGYEVNVFDQRQEVVTMVDNNYADSKAVVSYARIDQVIPEGENSYVFVMTHSHETDQQVIELLAGKQYRYLGLMGSRRKIDILKQKLSDRIGPADWENIHAPLGLPIKSRTPMEIAVSIAAELIQFDNAENSVFDAIIRSPSGRK
ncbi:XdhC family protein [Methylomarinum vadi]|uniref:XdhC family protein n=1 Tax=Methylomarinum vadi TaxID=438855 RepID=UPI00069078BF|nr:XdhC/CoxI family protein [Methylomarinum vadi]